MIIRRTVVAVALAALIASGTAVSADAATIHVGSAKHFQNCTLMHKVYPHGVARAGARDHVRGRTTPVTRFKVSTALYNANKGSDRDKDGVACEQ
jgi:uncharacterized membrane protein